MCDYPYPKVENKIYWAQRDILECLADLQENLETDVAFDNARISIVPISPAVQDQLYFLMGTATIIINDKAYMEKVRRKHSEEFWRSLLRRVKTREAAEIQRSRKLWAEGKSSPDSIGGRKSNDMLLKLPKGKKDKELFIPIKIPETYLMKSAIVGEDTGDLEDREKLEVDDIDHLIDQLDDANLDQMYEIAQKVLKMKRKFV